MDCLPQDDLCHLQRTFAQDQANIQEPYNPSVAVLYRHKAADGRLFSFMMIDKQLVMFCEDKNGTRIVLKSEPIF